MKRFQFSLERVAKFRNQEKRLSEIELANWNQKLDQAKEQLRTEQQRLFELLSHNSDETTHINPDVRQSHQYLVQQQIENVETALRKTAEVQKEWQMASDANQKAAANCEVLQQLKEEKHSEYLDERAKSEYIEQGDIYLRQWANKEKGK